MLWHATSELQRQTPRGFVGMSYLGHPTDVTASEKLNLGRRRT